MTFGNTVAFWLLSVIVLLLATAFWGWKAKKEMAKIWLDEKKVKISQIRKYILAASMLIIVIFAVAAPKIPFALPLATEKEGFIVFMVDVSGSMAAKKDLDSPSRLERIKPMLQEIINEFPEATFYPFHFTDIARSITPPLTKENFPYLKGSIERVLDIYSAPGKDSSLGTPILQVINKIPEGEKVKIIVLFSDGEFFKAWIWVRDKTVGDPNLDQAIGKAIQENVKIVTVGVGEKEGSRIPLYDQEGEFTGEFAKYDGKVFVTKLEEETLKLIASKTRGEYFFEEDLGGIMDFLDRNMESKAVGSQNGYQDISYLLLIPVALLWIVFARFYLK